MRNWSESHFLFRLDWCLLSEVEFLLEFDGLMDFGRCGCFYRQSSFLKWVVIEINSEWPLVAQSFLSEIASSASSVCSRLFKQEHQSTLSQFLWSFKSNTWTTHQLKFQFDPQFQIKCPHSPGSWRHLRKVSKVIDSFLRNCQFSPHVNVQFSFYSDD